MEEPGGHHDGRALRGAGGAALGSTGVGGPRGGWAGSDPRELSWTGRVVPGWGSSAARVEGSPVESVADEHRISGDRTGKHWWGRTQGRCRVGVP